MFFLGEDYEELSRQGSQSVMDYAMKKTIPEIFQTLSHSTNPNPVVRTAKCNINLLSYLGS